MTLQQAFFPRSPAGRKVHDERATEAIQFLKACGLKIEDRSEELLPPDFTILPSQLIQIDVKAPSGRNLSVNARSFERHLRDYPRSRYIWWREGWYGATIEQLAELVMHTSDADEQGRRGRTPKADRSLDPSAYYLIDVRLIEAQ